MRRDPPRVLVLTGTSEYPFRRLLAAVPALVATGAAAEVRVQSREAPAASVGVLHLGMLRRADVGRELAEADVVVTHGGSGSVLEALGAGHRPIVVPRRGSLGEHADDHQEDLAAELARRGLASVPGEPLAERLVDAVRAAAWGPREPLRPRSLGAALRSVVDEVGAGRRRRPDPVRVVRVEAAEFDRLCAPLGWRSPLQSSAWGLARASDGWEARWWVARARSGETLAGAQCLRRRVGEPLYLPYGPVMADGPASLAAARGLLRHLARGPRAGTLWAPAWFHARLGLAGTVGERRVGAGSTTGLLDLARDDAALRRSLRGTWRNDLEKAERDASLVLAFDDPDVAAAPLLEEVAALAVRRGFPPPVAPDVAARFAGRSRAAGVRVLAPTVRGGDVVLARYLVAVAGHVAQTLWTAGSADERSPGAGRLALWAGIRAARDAGARVYDLAGIDDQANPGVARFKRGVGPEIVDVPGLSWLPPAFLPPPLARALAGPLARVVRRRFRG